LGVKRPGREAGYSPPSSGEVKECVELYLRSPNTTFIVPFHWTIVLMVEWLLLCFLIWGSRIRNSIWQGRRGSNGKFSPRYRFRTCLSYDYRRLLVLG